MLRNAIFLSIVIAYCSCTNHTENATGSTSATDTSMGTSAIMPTGRGEEIFKQRCNACHGVEGAARNNNAADLQVSRIDSNEVARIIRNGRNNMPMFSKEALPDSDLAQVVTYVQSLRK